jgi:hypothetical protein
LFPFHNPFVSTNIGKQNSLNNYQKNILKLIVLQKVSVDETISDAFAMRDHRQCVIFSLFTEINVSKGFAFGNF